MGYAREKRVFPVSPTSFVAYLQVIILGMKGMQIEQHPHEVMAYVASLDKDFARFKEDFDLVGTHIGQARSKFAEADRRLDKLELKLEHAGDDRPVEVESTSASARSKRPRRAGTSNAPLVVHPVQGWFEEDAEHERRRT